MIAVPNTNVVLAFAEERGGAAVWGCEDGAGKGIAMKTSYDGGKTFNGRVRYIANDTDPFHLRIQDGVILGGVLYNKGKIFLFL